MKTVEEFKKDVLAELADDQLRSYCPLCYGAMCIVNSHRCMEGWGMYFNFNGTYEDKVKICVQRFNSIKPRHNIMIQELIYK